MPQAITLKPPDAFDNSSKFGYAITPQETGDPSASNNTSISTWSRSVSPMNKSACLLPISASRRQIYALALLVLSMHLSLNKRQLT